MANSSAKYLSFIMAILAIAACSGDNSENYPPPPAPAADAAADAPAETAADAAITEAADVEAKPDAAKPVSDPECSEVEDQEAAVLFKAPLRGDGYLAAAAKIGYASLANKPDVPLADPFPGCVAKKATDQALSCGFGLAYPGTKITFILGMNEFGGPTEKLGAWFSQINGDKAVYYGEYFACVGKKLVGNLKDGKFDGALAPTSDPLSPAFIDYTVP